MPAVCNVDGRIVPEAEATVPVLDRGFLFGDSVYEVLRTHARVPFAWPEHLHRLRTSADAILMEIAASDRDIAQRIVDTIAASGGGPGDERYIRLIVTRGSGSSPGIDLAEATGPQRVVVMVRDLPTGKVNRPTRAALVARRPRPASRDADPAVKSGNYVANVVGLAEARQRGADECIFVDPEGFATEASTANLYVVRDGAVETPPLGSGLLAGITRQLLSGCAAAQGIAIAERRLSVPAVRTASEVFLSGTVRGIAPVVELDGARVGDGTAGPLTRRLQAAFAELSTARAKSDAAALSELGVITDR
jgi:branched-chain amino acid aminotransferase